MTRKEAGRLALATALTTGLLLGSLFLAGGFGAGHRALRPSQPPMQLKPQQIERLGRAPLAFEAAQGGTYHTRGPGYDLLVDGGGSRLIAGGRTTRTLRTALVGANTSAKPNAGRALAFRVNRAQGPRRDWRTGIRTYADVSYAGVYDGVDVRYHGRRGMLEYDFIVAPHANPGAIGLRFRGADSLRLTHNGDLVATVGKAIVRQHKPVSYQLVDGKRVDVPSRFVLEGGQVRFELGRYDRSRRLVIDPSLAFRDYIGGSGVDSAARIAIDGAGNMYLTGTTSSTMSAATTNGVKSSGRDAYVLKLAPSGERQWITYLGNTGADLGVDIALDGSNLPYVTGITKSPGLSVTSGRPYGGGDTDAFVAALNSNGSVRWSDLYASPDSDTASQIAVTPEGDVYLASNTVTGTYDNPTTPMIGRLAIWGANGVYAGQEAVGSGTGDDTLDAVALLPGCNQALCEVYIAGHTTGQDPDGAAGTKVRLAWLARYDPAQQATTGGYLWGPAPITYPEPAGTSLTYSGGEWPSALAVDPSGNALLIGTKSAGAHPWVFTLRAAKEAKPPANLGDPPQPILEAIDVIFSNPPLNGDSTGDDITSDAQGNVYITGSDTSTNGSDIDPVLPRGKAFDGFALKYFPDGQPVEGDIEDTHPKARIVWSTNLGGDNSEFGTGIVTDATGGTYVSGTTNGSNFLPSPATRPYADADMPDGWVVKIQTNGASITEGPDGAIARRDVTFKFSSGETGGSYLCRLLGPGGAPAFTDCNSGAQDFKGLADGSYTFEIQAFDRGGTSNGSTTKRQFSIDSTLHAAFSIAPNPVLAGRPVTFDASESHGLAAISKYEWDLDGNGSFETNGGTAPTITQTYSTPGSLNIGLRVTDAEGNTGTAVNALQVNSGTAPGAQFGVTINNGAQFTNKPAVTVTSTFPTFTTSLLFSNDGGFGKAQTFPAKKDTAWVLDSSGPERLPKTIYVRFLNGLVPGETHQDDIILDEIPPKVDQAVVVPPAAAPAAATAAKLRTYKIKIKARDSNSGVAVVQITANKKKPGKALKYKRKLTVKSAKKPKWARARDRAGNWSKWKKMR
jgi:hypothetical protein